MCFISSLWQTVFTHDEQQLPSPKVGTQLRLHGEFTSTVFPDFFFLTRECNECLRFFLYSFFADNNNEFH